MMSLKKVLEADDEDVERADPEAVRCALELMHAILHDSTTDFVQCLYSGML